MIFLIGLSIGGRTLDGNLANVVLPVVDFDSIGAAAADGVETRFGADVFDGSGAAGGS